MRVEPDRDAAAASVDDLEPDEGHQPDRGRPAPDRFGVAQVGGPLTGDRREGPADRAGDRAPGIERRVDVADQNAEQGKAQPAGDEDEGQREVAIGSFGAMQARVDGDPEQEDADRPEQDLCRPPEEHPREPRREGTPPFVLEAGRPPGDREREEGDDQDDRRRPRKQPCRDRQVLPRRKRVREGKEGEAHGFTRSSAICSSAGCTSMS